MGDGKMKKIALIVWLVLIAGLAVPPQAVADGMVVSGPERVAEHGSLDGIRMAAAFAKKEGLTTQSRTEAMALGRRIQVDISKMEAELSRLSREPAAQNSSMRKGLPAVKGAVPVSNMKGPSESLLRQAENLNRLYRKESLQEGMERHSGPMAAEARRLNQLANKYPEAVKSGGGQRVLREMGMILNRLRSLANTHQGWVQGQPAVPAAAGPLSKPVPAHKVAPGSGGVMHDKWSPDAGGVMIDKSSPDAGGVMHDKWSPDGGGVMIDKSGADYDGVDGESLPAVQDQTGTTVYPKVEIKAGEAGYEGIDGESIGQ
jgi:hypothetical protein